MFWIKWFAVWLYAMVAGFMLMIDDGMPEWAPNLAFTIIFFTGLAVLTIVKDD